MARNGKAKTVADRIIAVVLTAAASASALNQLNMDLCQSIHIGSDIVVGLEPDLGRSVVVTQDKVEVLRACSFAQMVGLRGKSEPFFSSGVLFQIRSRLDFGWLRWPSGGFFSLRPAQMKTVSIMAILANQRRGPWQMGLRWPQRVFGSFFVADQGSDHFLQHCYSG